MIFTEAASFIDGGWTPFSERTRPQQLQTEAFHERIGTFEFSNTGVREDNRFICAELEFQTYGKPLPRFYQFSGSCVGVGGAKAYLSAAFLDHVIRGDNEEVKPCYPFATYGVGRQIAGMRGKGSGSYGAAQAKAVAPETFGMLAWDDPRVPQPQNPAAYWLKYSERTEIDWSHSNYWPVKRSELFETATAFGVHTVTRVKSVEGAKQAIAQGYPLTIAGSKGFSMSVRGDVLMGRNNKSWNHQQQVDAYWYHPQMGLIFGVNNQWEDVHGKCPTLGKFGVNGSYWITSNDMQHFVANETYAHSNTGGFPTRKFVFTSVGTFF